LKLWQVWTSFSTARNSPSALMKISLILATKGRVDEVSNFLRSLSQQSTRNFELIIVDQNEDDRLNVVLTGGTIPFPVTVLQSASGLSHARNVGLTVARGDIIGFPDDDCWYPPELLAQVRSKFKEQASLDGLTGSSQDSRGRVSGGSFSRQQGRVDLGNVWRRGISYTIFLRSSVSEAVGAFDEDLGVGAKTGFASGEETDYLIRAIKMGFDIQYQPDLVVFHPNPPLYNLHHRAKAFRYGMGMGRVLTKHRYNLGFDLYTVARPFAGAVLSLITFRGKKAAYHLAIARGRICGLCS
jgi:glycosyltransferase involved in cell wall biosynthesis